MAANSAFTAGVKPGGLTSSTEIRLLLCYLIKTAAPVTRQELETALLGEALVNYFELASGLEDLLQQELAVLSSDGYTITEKGCRVASELEYDLPRTVRESAFSAVLRIQAWNRKSAEYSAELTELSDGKGWLVKCTLNCLSEQTFCLQLTAPDRQTAEFIRQRFILHGSEIYAQLVTRLTDPE